MSATGRPEPGATPAGPWRNDVFPWDDALALALGVLRWSPRDVWAATPRELAAAAGLPGRPALRRADLARLIAAHPDAGPASEGA